jgi:hypothetical protein
MYVDKGEVVRVRVEADDFYDDEPGPPKATEGVQAVRQRARPPYTITVRTQQCLSVAASHGSCTSDASAQ